MPIAPQLTHRFAGRAYKIAEQIRTGTQVTAENLAETFNVSKRTIYRDLDLLRKSGISVQYDNLTDSYCIMEEKSRSEKGPSKSTAGAHFNTCEIWSSQLVALPG